MKRNLTTVLFFFFLSQASFAQSKWNGFYFGLHGGYHSGKVDFGSYTQIFQQITNVNPPGPQPLTVVPGTSRELPSAQAKPTSAAVVLQAGYEQQKQAFVFGGEFSVFFAKTEGRQYYHDSLPPTALSGYSPFAINKEASMNWALALTPKLGYAFDKALLYVTGGILFGATKVETSDTFTSKCCGPGTNGNPPAQYSFPPPQYRNTSDKEMSAGFTWGFGMDWKLSEKMALGIVYRHNRTSKNFHPGTEYRSFDPNTGQVVPASQGALAQTFGEGPQKIKFAQNVVGLSFKIFPGAVMQSSNRKN